MIGYCVPINPKLASFRLRVAIPSKFVGPHVIGGLGDVTFFYKNGNPSLARKVGQVVYDVVNAHFDDPDYRAMCEITHTVTCSSEVMREIVKRETGRDAVVIPDPYENAESDAQIAGNRIMWFGHQANIASLQPFADLEAEVLTAEDWSLENERSALARAAVVLLTGNNPGASANRPAKALRAGRFVVAPEDCPVSWKEIPGIWIGDVREGISWAFANREEACQRVKSAQKYVRETFNPQLIGSQWADLFASTSGQDITTTDVRTAGSALTST